VRHPAGLAHSFNNTVLYLDYERRGFDYPIVLFHVNCYGQSADVDQRGRGRRGIGRGLAAQPKPGALLCHRPGGRRGSLPARRGGWRWSARRSWSHGSLTPKHGRLYPDIEADRVRAEELRSGGFRDWGKISQSAIEESGQHEILNWICLAGAMTELGNPVRNGRFRRELLLQLGENASRSFRRPLRLPRGARPGSRGSRHERRAGSRAIRAGRYGRRGDGRMSYDWGKKECDAMAEDRADKLARGISGASCWRCVTSSASI